MYNELDLPGIRHSLAVSGLAKEQFVFGLDRRVGIPLGPRWFRYRGRRHKLRRSDIAHIKLLARIVDQANDSTALNAGWLLPYRGDFRQMREGLSRAVLAHVVLHARSPGIRRLATWLLGHCPGTLGIKALAIATRDKELVMRREAARALKRKGGWAELRDLQAHDPDERIQAFARQAGPKPHSERLDQYLDDVTPQEIGDQQKRLQLNVDLRVRPGLPPKTSQMIRHVLERIHRLVHGYIK